MIKDHAVLTMAALRVFSGLVEVLAALFILRINRVDIALRINCALAIIGPSVLLAGIFIGVVAISDRLPYGRLALIYLGAFFIFWGTRQS
jgi:hypothetical protein